MAQMHNDKQEISKDGIHSQSDNFELLIAFMFKKTRDYEIRKLQLLLVSTAKQTRENINTFSYTIHFFYYPLKFVSAKLNLRSLSITVAVTFPNYFLHARRGEQHTLVIAR
jgi:hypothetical protein